MLFCFNCGRECVTTNNLCGRCRMEAEENKCNICGNECDPRFEICNKCENEHIGNCPSEWEEAIEDHHRESIIEDQMIDSYWEAQTELPEWGE